MLSKRYESTVELGYMCPRGLTHWSTSSDTQQVVEILKQASTKIKDVKIHVFVKHYAPGGNKVQKTILAQRSKSRSQGH